MRVGRIQHAGHVHWVVFDADGDLEILRRAPWEGIERSGRKIGCEEISFLSPVEPSKIVCIGLNYRAHAQEMKKALPSEPVMFLKAPSAVIAHEGVVKLPPESTQVEYEGELAIVFGKRTHRVSVEKALSGVFGYTCLNDVTARDIQHRENIYARAKGFDTFCPVGPWIETEIFDPGDLELTLRVNRVVRQHSSTADMIFSVAQLVAFVSNVMTLLPGDILSTGTPSGVGQLTAGDQVEVEIERIGVLRNTVALATCEI
jgi:2-keto-4-pentenoate hydratase/2-oxohepta-3-ene-1,7-dioic acid hydratase in catechol pathway